jgi:hypothetical protein
VTGKFLLAVVYIIEACEWAKAKANQATRRAMEAGLEGYFAFLRGKRVTYWGGDGLGTSTPNGFPEPHRPKARHK